MALATASSRNKLHYQLSHFVKEIFNFFNFFFKQEAKKAQVLNKVKCHNKEEDILTDLKVTPIQIQVQFFETHQIIINKQVRLVNSKDRLINNKYRLINNKIQEINNKVLSNKPSLSPMSHFQLITIAEATTKAMLPLLTTKAMLLWLVEQQLQKQH